MLKRRSHRVRDVVLYVAVGVVIAAVAALLGMYEARTGQRIDDKLVGFALNTVFVFGLSLHTFRRLLKRPKFWAITTILLLLHGSIGTLAISQVERIPLIWYVPVDVAEIAVIGRVLERAFREGEQQHA